MADMTELLVIGGVIVGGYYLYSSGMLDSILGGFMGPPPGYYDGEDVYDQFEAEVEEEEEEGKGKKGKGGKGGAAGGKGGKSGGRKKKKRREDVYPQQGPPPGYPGPQGPPPSAPPPGAISSLYPMNVPQGPPYQSRTVGTYSQYSPYNQFNAYQEYRTPPRGTASTMADDNIYFNDIDAGRSYQCYQCKTFCQSSPNSIQCQMCRMPCKNITHTFIPPSKGWTIAPVGQLPYYSGLGMIADTLLGKGATFAEMDDYSQTRRFDCHNKLKRRVKGKDNQFVTQSDYYYDRNDIQFANV
jgi:hypothetical protein